MLIHLWNDRIHQKSSSQVASVSWASSRSKRGARRHCMLISRSSWEACCSQNGIQTKLSGQIAFAGTTVGFIVQANKQTPTDPHFWINVFMPRYPRTRRFGGHPLLRFEETIKPLAFVVNDTILMSLSFCRLYQV